MLKGIDLVTLAQRIQANQTLKRDYIAETKKLEVAADTDGKISLIVPDHGRFPILPLAHRQIGTHLRIPADYYQRMMADIPDLLARNINDWMVRQPADARRMVRTLGGDNRAFLSNAYQRIEHEEIAQVALPIIMDLPSVNIVSCEITEKRLYIHFVVPGVQGEVKVGDVVQAGGIISNSEVGLGSVSVSGFLWRLICLNGAKTSDAYRRHHVGRRVEDSEALWADDTKKADDKAVLLKVRDMVKAVTDETRFRQRLAQMKGLFDAKIAPGSTAKAVEVLTQELNLPDATRPSILDALARGGDLSAWGLLNAVTAQAHTATDYDAAVEIEAAGGSLLDLPAGSWKRILEAA